MPIQNRHIDDRHVVGLVVENFGNEYLVEVDDKQYLCRLKGKFKIKGLRTTNPIAIGDEVCVLMDEVSKNEEKYLYIDQILPRKNYIIRRSINLSKEAHILGANLDRALLLVTMAYPSTPIVFIDRFLATAEAYGIPARLVFNKVDLYDSSAMRQLNELIALYKKLGYIEGEDMVISATDDTSLTAVRKMIAKGVTLIAGQSGVGKSTLINHLIPNVNQKTAAISDVHSTGVHTTTHSKMIPVGDAFAGYLIDTPGIKGFGTIEFEPHEVGHYFPEIFEHSAACKYNNCTHTHEPQCAVLAAVKNGVIATSRYKSYLSILNDKDDPKYREAY